MLAKNLDRIKKWNDIIHKNSYQSGRFAWYEGGLSEDIKQYLPLLQERKVHYILDVGCGDGTYTLPLAELGYKVTGLDISSEGIKAAQKHAEEKGITNIEFFQGNMQAMPFKDSSFDFLISGFAIGEMLLFPHTTMEDARLVIKEIYRVLKDDAFAFLQLTEKVVKEYKTKKVTDKILEKQQWEGILRKCGFSINQITQNSFKDPAHLGASHGYDKPHTHYWCNFLVKK